LKGRARVSIRDASDSRVDGVHSPTWAIGAIAFDSLRWR
jgi:hypothetical protein